MDKSTLFNKPASAIAVAALLSACATVDTGVGWNIPRRAPPGK